MADIANIQLLAYILTEYNPFMYNNQRLIVQK